MLQIAAALFYYKLGQMLLQMGEAITNWDKMYYKLIQLLQIREFIKKWEIITRTEISQT